MSLIGARDVAAAAGDHLSDGGLDSIVVMGADGEAGYLEHGDVAAGVAGGDLDRHALCTHPASSEPLAGGGGQEVDGVIFIVPLHPDELAPTGLDDVGQVVDAREVLFRSLVLLRVAPEEGEVELGLSGVILLTVDPLEDATKDGLGRAERDLLVLGDENGESLPVAVVDDGPIVGADEVDVGPEDVRNLPSDADGLTGDDGSTARMRTEPVGQDLSGFSRVGVGTRDGIQTPVAIVDVNSCVGSQLRAFGVSCFCLSFVGCTLKRDFTAHIRCRIQYHT